MNRSLAVQVYIRDGWQCRHCRSRESLTPHHVVYKSRGGADSLNNLICLCIICHDAVHQKKLDISVLEVYPEDIKVNFWRRRNWKP